MKYQTLKLTLTSIGLAFCIALFVLMMTGCDEMVFSNIQNTEDSDQEKNEACFTWAETLIPEHITYKWYDYIGAGLPYFERGSWTNGARMESRDAPNVRQGSEKGENINHYYLYQEIGRSKNAFFSYGEKVISDEGVVLGSNSFRVSFVLQRDDSTIKTHKGGVGSEDSFTANFKIIESTFLECNYVG